MKLVQTRIVTDDVEGLAGFYASLVGTPVALNEYYVEVQAGPMSVGFSKCRFTEYCEDQATRPRGSSPGTRSSSTSWLTTWTRNTSASRR